MLRVCMRPSPWWKPLESRLWQLFYSRVLMAHHTVNYITLPSLFCANPTHVLLESGRVGSLFSLITVVTYIHTCACVCTNNKKDSKFLTTFYISSLYPQISAAIPPNREASLQQMRYHSFVACVYMISGLPAQHWTTVSGFIPGRG